MSNNFLQIFKYFHIKCSGSREKKIRSLSLLEAELFGKNLFDQILLIAVCNKNAWSMLEGLEWTNTGHQYDFGMRST